MSEKKNLQFDSWLSEVCGRDVYRLSFDSEYRQKILKQDSAEAKELKKVQSKKVFIYSKIATSSLKDVELAEDKGFHLVDTNVTLEKHFHSSHTFNNNCELAFAKATDEELTVQVAAHSFIFSRFHLDQKFSKELADYVKAEWVRNYFKGSRGEWMVLAKKNNTVVGFLQLISDKKETLIIDLIAVDTNYRRLGIANDMIAFAEKNLTQFKHIRVGTQVANVPSLKLYQRMGFSIIDSSYVFHYHYS